MSSISIIIPVYNEEQYIANCLDSILSSVLDFKTTEIIIIDGNSTDKTLEIITEYQKKYSFVKIFKNPHRIVSISMNIGITNSVGEYIVRLDAHSIYPSDYISKLVYWIKKLKADNVGGVWDIFPTNDSLEAKAIAYSTSNSFGIGNAQYKITNKIEPYRVDTVPFGCYKRDIFSKIGLYDIDLTRNQDDELNARLIQNGGKIFLIPDVKIKYFARENFYKMFKMFYQYGYFKPLVNIKLKKPSTVRQFIPLLFVLFLGFGSLLSFLSPLFLFLFILGLSVYFGINILVACNIAKNKKNILLIPYLITSFFLIHFSYGIGYLKGILDFVVLQKWKRNKNKYLKDNRKDNL